MKNKRFVLLAAVCFFALSFTAGCNKNPLLDTEPGSSVAATVETWEFPEDCGRNTDFKVEISADGKTWETLAVYNVKNGHQSASDPLLKTAGITYSGTPYTASLAIFDFTGTVGVRVTYQNGTLSEGGYVISPASYAVKSAQEGNTVTFTLTQDAENPRKVVFRPAGEWGDQTLHIMTNVPEGAAAINKNADNVFVIRAGDEVPLTLPAGKDVYYFDSGMHTLPAGYWADIDLGGVNSVSKFSIIVPMRTPGGLCFELQAKTLASDAYQTVYKSAGESAAGNTGTVSVSLNGVSGRYFRLILRGNYSAVINSTTRYFNMSYVRELSLYSPGGANLALGKAVAGAGGNFALLTDGSADTGDYGHDNAGERFPVFSGTEIYLAKGAVAAGSLLADGAQNIRVSGRGIMDGSCVQQDRRYVEGRTGAILFLNCKDVKISGITALNFPCWMVVVNYSENVLVSGLNLFGAVMNADGIHFSATKNAVATGCFIRACDDIFVAYHYGGANGLTFQNCVVWTDGARVLLLGLAAVGDIKNVVMKNCDVITFQNVHDLGEYGGLIHIVATGGRTIKNVLIKDIRIDELRAPIIAQLAQLRAGNKTEAAGYIDGVTLENITSAVRIPPKSLISNVVSGGGITNVTLKNISFGETAVTAGNLSNYFNKDADIEVRVE